MNECNPRFDRPRLQRIRTYMDYLGTKTRGTVKTLKEKICWSVDTSRFKHRPQVSVILFHKRSKRDEKGQEKTRRKP
jgi:hypothetical protein